MRAFGLRLLVLAAVLVGLSALTVTLWQGALDRYAGAWNHAPEDAPWVLSDRAQSLVDAAFADANGRPVRDARVAAGIGFAAREADALGGGRHPLAWLADRIRAHAAGVHGEASAPEAEYAARLMRQIAAMPGAYRAQVFARDAVFAADGRAEPERSLNMIANTRAGELAARAPAQLEGVVSVHPYRADAVDTIASWAEAGITHIGWWPVAQGIDLDDPRVAESYAAMAEHGMTLHLPVGARAADNGASGWVDPSVLRAPLAAGVRVVVTLGRAHGEDGQRLMPGLFSLLRESAWADSLAVDLAGVLTTDQFDDVLRPLLQHPQFFSRLRYASGYPQSAIAASIRLSALVDGGFLDPALVAPLREIYGVNPLLFVFVTLRQVRLPATELRLPDAVFFGEPPS